MQSPCAVMHNLADMGIEIGLRGEAQLSVGKEDTALAMGTGSLELLSTSRLIVLCEQAATNAVQRDVVPPMTTVGMRVQIDHLQPVAIEQQVTVEAVLERIEGRRLTFVISASNERGLVAAGKLIRVVVDSERFLERCR